MDRLSFLFPTKPNPSKSIFIGSLCLLLFAINSLLLVDLPPRSIALASLAEYIIVFFYVFRELSLSIFLKTRIVLLTILPFLESLLLSINPSYVISSIYPWLIPLQSRYLLVQCGFLALAGSLIGWHIPYLLKQVDIVKFYPFKFNALQISFLSFFLGFLLFVADGGLVTGGNTYGAKKLFDIGFSGFNVIQAILASYVLCYYRHCKNISLAIYLLLASFLLGPLSGSRADFLIPIVIIIAFINPNLSSLITDKYKLSPSPLILRLSDFKRIVKAILYFAIIPFLILILIGIWRFAGNLAELSDVSSFISRRFLTESFDLSRKSTGLIIINLETLGPIINTFYAVTMADPIHRYAELFPFGSYFNWLYNLAPRFLGFDRIKGLEYFLQIYQSSLNLTITQGGIFELAEAFANFKSFGVFIVPLFWSLIFGFFEVRSRPNLRTNYLNLNAIIYIAIFLMSFRGTVYQNFTFFRTITTLLIVCTLYPVISKVSFRVGPR